MKIGINASFARKPDSGIGQVTVNFLKNLAENCDTKDTFFLYLEEDLPKDLKLPKNFKKRVLKTFYKRDDLFRKLCWEKYFLPLMIKEDNCEVFFSLYQNPMILKNIPHIMMVHDAITEIFPWYLDNWRKKFYYKQIDKAISKTDKIMTISEHSKIDINRLFNITESKIVVNYIDCDSIFKDKTTEKDLEKTLKKFGLSKKQYIFYVGGFDMRKNLAGLIQAYGVFWNNYKNKKDCPKLALAGKFNKHLVPLVTDIEAEINSVCLRFKIPEDNFKLLGFVEQKDLPALYKGARLFCFPSLYEGFGLPVLEAFNSGCPVVTSSNSSLKEIANNKNAFIFDLESDESLAEQLQKVSNSDKKNVDKKITQAKKDAGKFEWGKFVGKALREIKKVEM